MNDLICRATVEAVLNRLRYAVVAKRPDQTVFRDPDTGWYITIVFRDNAIETNDLVRNLEYEGITPALFFAEMDAM